MIYSLNYFLVFFAAGFFAAVFLVAGFLIAGLATAFFAAGLAASFLTFDLVSGFAFFLVRVFFGSTSGNYMEWDESADQLDVTGSFDVTGNTTMIGTLTVGVDDTGHDVKFFGICCSCSCSYISS